MTELYNQAYQFESATRLYSAEGVAQTLHTGETNFYATDPRQQSLNLSLSTVKDTISHYNPQHIRKLTPRECFRLQDFPDYFKLPCSDTQSYKQAGNSITCSVLYNLIKKFKL